MRHLATAVKDMQLAMKVIQEVIVEYMADKRDDHSMASENPYEQRQYAPPQQQAQQSGPQLPLFSQAITSPPGLQKVNWSQAQ